MSRPDVSPTTPLPERLRRATAWALVATALAPLLFLPRVLYPFVTTRAVGLRILVAVAAGLAAWLAVAYGERALRSGAARSLRRDPVAWALVLVLGWDLVASLAGLAPWQSLFGRVERMEGWIGWLHWAALYLLLRAVLREAEWRRLLEVVAAVGTVVAVVGLLQLGFSPLPGVEKGDLGLRPVGTLGNSGYLAAYMLFTGAATFLEWRRAPAGFRRWTAAAALVVQAAAIVAARSDAALLGAAAGAAAGLGVLAAATDRRALRRRSLGALGGLVALAAVFLAVPSLPGPLPSGRQIVDRALESPNVRQRRIAWRAAGAGIRERPVTGAGPENFLIVFDRHLDPAIYDASRNAQERHMDRAHNVWLGAAVTSGLPGGLLFMALWGAIFWVLYRRVRDGRLEPAEGAVLAGAFVAYTVYLFFWFAGPNAFPLFLTLAAWTASRGEGGGGPGDQRHPAGGRERSGAVGEPRLSPAARWGVAAAAVLLVGADLYHNGRLWAAARVYSLGTRTTALDERVDHCTRALELRPPGSQEVALQCASFYIGLQPQMEELRGSDGARRTFARGLERSLEAMRLEVERDPMNARVRAIYASLLMTAHLLTDDDRWLARAREAIARAVEMSPARMEYAHFLARVHLREGNPGAAVDALERALEVYAGLPETHRDLTRAYLAAGRPLEASRAFEDAVDRGLQPGGNRDLVAQLVATLRRQGHDAEADRVEARYGRG